MKNPDNPQLTERTLDPDWLVHFQGRAGSGLVLGHHTEEIIGACGQILHAVRGHVGLDLVHATPGGSWELPLFQHVGRQGHAAVILRGAPLDGGRRLGGGQDLDGTLWSGRGFWIGGDRKHKTLL